MVKTKDKTVEKNENNVAQVIDELVVKGNAALQELKKFNQEQAKKPYTRKCEVCGRTDRDFPNLEFRFCSKCGGYHCFCIDHINSHIHFTE